MSLFNYWKHGTKAKTFRRLRPSAGAGAAILKKDIWLCWVLRVLFSIPDRYPMAFMDGTFLSKVYGIIDRFSEDVNLLSTVLANMEKIKFALMALDRFGQFDHFCSNSEQINHYTLEW